MVKKLILLLLLLFPAGLCAGDMTAPLTDPVAEARAVALGSEFRCVVCQAQSINDSTATMAGDLRALVRRQIAAGKSDEEIRHYVQQRYGDFILLRPPMQTNTYILWLFPILLIAGGGFWVINFVWKHRDQG